MDIIEKNYIHKAYSWLDHITPGLIQHILTPLKRVRMSLTSEIIVMWDSALSEINAVPSNPIPASSSLYTAIHHIRYDKSKVAETSAVSANLNKPYWIKTTASCSLKSQCLAQILGCWSIFFLGPCPLLFSICKIFMNKPTKAAIMRQKNATVAQTKKVIQRSLLFFYMIITASLNPH